MESDTFTFFFPFLSLKQGSLLSLFYWEEIGLYCWAL
jgi:hypothetical protein